MTEVFENRRDAGRQLAERLTHVATPARVLALRRGGVPVGYEIARRLGSPLDVFVVRKLHVPGRKEFTMGAIAACDVRVVDDEIVRRLRIPPEWIDQAAAREALELRRRERLYRGDRSIGPLAGRTAILVDDSLACSLSMCAAIRAVRRLGPDRVVVAVPVGTAASCATVEKEEVDELICLERPAHLQSISRWYADFTPIGDEEIQRLLAIPKDESAHASFSP